MKFKHLAVAAAALVAGSAFAQSNVTLYGVIDAGARYVTNANAAGDNKLSLDQGAFSGNRWGLRGTEDLGGGLKANFTLESGFSFDTGAADQQGQLFGRQAWVGLSGGFGAVTLGRQYGVGFTNFASYDPLGAGNLSETLAPYGQIGIRFDNAIKYTGTFGPVGIDAMYALGETAGNNSAGRTLGLGLNFATGPVTANGFYQTTNDAASNKNNAYGLGGTFAMGPAKLYAGWLGSKRDAGFANNSSAQTNFGFLTSLMGGTTVAARKDNTFTLGVGYQATPALNLLLGGYYTKGKDVAGSGVDGTHTTAFAYADYALSKRTDTYIGLDYNKLKDGFVGATNYAKDSRTGVVVGVRHKF